LLILANLTDDVVWVINGHRETHGTAEFDGEIENPAFVGSPELDILRVPPNESWLPQWDESPTFPMRRH
jgi:hypothetical protein